MDDELVRFRVIAELLLRVVRQADSGIAVMRVDKVGFAAQDDHESSYRKLSAVVERGTFQVPLYELV